MNLTNSKSFTKKNFITIKDSSFFLNDREFKFFGFNAYYLQTIAANPAKRYIVDDVFKSAKENGINVIRTWAFNDNDSLISQAIIRTEPLKIIEEGLIALDYVLTKAKENNIYIILTLGNNYKNFGGIPQYLRWAKKYLVKKLFSFYSHNDFFINDSIKQWYKFNVETILNRKNTFNNEIYKNDNIIFSFELLNEAENPGKDHRIVKSWYEEMSAFIKNIDSNHLTATGEIGYDSFFSLFSEVNSFYKKSHFLLNGFKGTSFSKNSSLKNIDYLSFHLYPDGWRLSPKGGIAWIKDHNKIAAGLNKPVLLGEFGVKKNKFKVYKKWLQELENTRTQSGVVWQYLHPDLNWDDGFGFNEKNSPELINLFRNYINKLNKSYA